MTFARRSLVVLAMSAAACGVTNVEPVPSATLTVTSSASVAAGSAQPTASSLLTAEAPPAQSSAREVVIPASPSPQASSLATAPPAPPDGKKTRGPIDVSLDSAWILKLATAPFTEVKSGSGGSSVTMRVKLDDGSKAALKPEQNAHSSDPRAEIAAYHVDRLLGFGRTAVVVGRKLPKDALRAALLLTGADKSFLERFEREVVAHDGLVDAAMIAWHTAPLVEEDALPPWIGLLATGDPVRPSEAGKLGERSDLVVFDFLIDNPDRTSGGNILRLGKGGPLIFLDQGAAFGKNRLRTGQNLQSELDKVCRFRNDTLQAIGRVGPSAKPGERLGALLSASLLRDPLSPVLDAAHIAAVDARTAALLRHVSACSARLKGAFELPLVR